MGIVANYYIIKSKLITNKVSSKNSKSSLQSFLANFLNIDIKNFPNALRPIITFQWEGSKDGPNKFIMKPDIEVNIELKNQVLQTEFNKDSMNLIRNYIISLIPEVNSSLAIDLFFVVDIKVDGFLNSHLANLQKEIIKLLTLSEEAEIDSESYLYSGIVKKTMNQKELQVYNFATLQNLLVTSSPKMALIIRNSKIKDEDVLYSVLEATLLIFIGLKITNEILVNITTWENSITDLFAKINNSKKSIKSDKKNINDVENNIMNEVMDKINDLKNYRQLSSILMCFHMSYITSSFAGEHFYNKFKEWTGLSNLKESLHYKLENSHYLLTYLMDFYQFKEITSFDK